MFQDKNVVSAYSGRAGACCCGCKGTHWKDSEGKNAQRQISRVCKILNDNKDSVIHEGGDSYLTLGNRVYIVYYE